MPPKPSSKPSSSNPFAALDDDESSTDSFSDSFDDSTDSDFSSSFDDDESSSSFSSDSSFSSESGEEVIRSSDVSKIVAEDSKAQSADGKKIVSGASSKKPGDIDRYEDGRPWWMLSKEEIEEQRKSSDEKTTKPAKQDRPKKERSRHQKAGGGEAAAADEEAKEKRKSTAKKSEGHKKEKAHVGVVIPLSETTPEKLKQRLASVLATLGEAGGRKGSVLRSSAEELRAMLPFLPIKSEGSNETEIFELRLITLMQLVGIEIQLLTAGVSSRIFSPEFQTVDESLFSSVNPSSESSSTSEPSSTTAAAVRKTTCKIDRIFWRRTLSDLHQLIQALSDEYGINFAQESLREKGKLQGSIDNEVREKRKRVMVIEPDSVGLSGDIMGTLESLTAAGVEPFILEKVQKAIVNIRKAKAKEQNRKIKEEKEEEEEEEEEESKTDGVVICSIPTLVHRLNQLQESCYALIDSDINRNEYLEVLKDDAPLVTVIAEGQHLCTAIEEMPSAAALAQMRLDHICTQRLADNDASSREEKHSLIKSLNGFVQKHLRFVPTPASVALRLRSSIGLCHFLALNGWYVEARELIAATGLGDTMSRLANGSLTLEMMALREVKDRNMSSSKSDDLDDRNGDKIVEMLRKQTDSAPTSALSKMAIPTQESANAVKEVGSAGYQGEVGLCTQYHRMIAQMGLTAFNKEILRETGMWLEGIADLPIGKDLLGSPDKGDDGKRQNLWGALLGEMSDRQKSGWVAPHNVIPYEIVETAYLFSMLLSEVISMAQHGLTVNSALAMSISSTSSQLEQKKRFVCLSRGYRGRVLSSNPTPGARDRVLEAAGFLLGGEWEKAVAAVLQMPGWRLFSQFGIADVESRITRLVNMTAQRVELIQAPKLYESLSIDYFWRKYYPEKAGEEKKTPEKEKEDEAKQKEIIRTMIIKMLLGGEICGFYDEASDCVVFSRNTAIGATDLGGACHVLSDRARKWMYTTESLLQMKELNKH
ncbi:Translation initiation factor 3 subunit C [Monocercomonoides exilis]|uniref:Translation initiation factor 3 subunit C n=1 Tax=Monocercomonoides exilis TaxID=2049356 RepID=UPI0035596D71|nr:Translation initiation factor 3 subunit C [Monocercomonoides exilis]|eukprot:MONOS_12135.1-p1 / transcript=MONOS_12135.1 / gene=MONOS_12135 / organism=Monocercomonoides_exilis_PA203 / gene_product=Translation initiation factor 3 subunit C / transcript_product=Translation initiation factor 3 subunit C / location=Mono_scaffold00650:28382-31351(+) / protein_length=990 / sequence_SO=supercontig / SO=protein_coding / is_pseudo=false